jgi:molybdopterin-guanine dinucleotide biosynthesis protein A
MQRTVIILAGGKGQRVQARDKCLIPLGSKPLIQHVVENLAGVADELIVAARDEQQGAAIKERIPNTIALVYDSVEGFGPLAGFLAGLARAAAPYALIIGCDMPFVDPQVVELLFAVAAHGEYDAVVPQWKNGMLEPLHAVYKREPTLAAVRDAISRGDEKLANVLARLRHVHFLPIPELREITPDLRTFRNINTHAELATCAALLTERHSDH